MAQRSRNAIFMATIKDTDFMPMKDLTSTQFYEVRIEGHLHAKWASWFDGMSIQLEESGETLLAGPVIDQAALYGLLKKVRNLGMPLISVNRKSNTKELSK